MTEYRVICTIQEPLGEPHEYAHIVQVGTGSDAGWNQMWTVAQVIQAKAAGDRFYTLSPSTGKRADVVVVNCPSCGRQILRTVGDVVTDNNLDELPRCKT